jgi:hypothetical protein
MQLRDNLGAIGWSLTPEQIKRLDEASTAMPAYPYSFYRTQESFARINPPPEALVFQPNGGTEEVSPPSVTTVALRHQPG